MAGMNEFRPTNNKQQSGMLLIDLREIRQATKMLGSQLARVFCPVTSGVEKKSDKHDPGGRQVDSAPIFPGGLFLHFCLCVFPPKSVEIAVQFSISLGMPFFWANFCRVAKKIGKLARTGFILEVGRQIFSKPALRGSFRHHVCHFFFPTPLGL